LPELLKKFGGGLEISLLSAVPKGSGLGTSSILAATLLVALSRACNLGWDVLDIYQRVLSIEQLLTTGGGWQDQAGALFGGVKLIQTGQGLVQTPSVRYLPGQLIGDAHANHTLLLYYTGVTRLAKGILKEIVHDMFLGRSATIRTLGLIRINSQHLHQALQEDDQSSMHRCIARSWDLNRRLDPDTTTPQIESIIRTAGADLAACKLLGAGGGGYMLLCADTPEAGQRIRTRLTENPPNVRARFIDFQVSDRPVEVTVS
jgi:galactokinase/mevalonate kinase-like predicted kinase